MKISARQLTLDLYNCDSKKISDIGEIKNILYEIIGGEPALSSDFIDENSFSIVGVTSEGHIALHVYFSMRYVAVDIFTCSENSEPEELAKALRKFFKPDKMKSTFLKRGDFTSAKDIKPKIKTRVSPLRKVRNAGAKAVNLVRRGNR